MIESCRLHAEVGLVEDPGMLLYGLSLVWVNNPKDFDLREEDLILARVYLDHDAKAADESGDAWVATCGELERSGGEILFTREYVGSGSGFEWKGRS